MEYEHQGTRNIIRPDDYKAWSIINLVFSIIFCCCTCTGIISLFLSIIALSKASDLNRSLTMGELGIIPAQETSNTIKNLNIVSSILIAIGIIASLIYYSLYGLAMLS